MKAKLFITALSAATIILTSFTQSFQKNESNYVPDKETAIKVAEAILVPIYGEDILKKKPFTATSIDNKIWRVEGTLNLDELGGVPIVKIQKSDCKILSVTHTK